MKKILFALLVAMMLVLACSTAMATGCGDDHFDSEYEGYCKHDEKYLKEDVQYPTCEASGKIDVICTKCGEVVESTQLSAQGHDMKLVEDVKPFCEIAGYKLYECQRTGCGHYEVKEVEALEHDWHFIRVYKEDTCTEVGLHLYKCLRCELYKTEEVDVVKHDWKKTDSEKATCTKDGFEEYTCTICTAQDIVILPALGHDWTAWDIDEAPTCEQPGMASRYCKRPGCEDTNLHDVAKETKVIEPHGHLVDPSYVTINEDGTATGICVYCSKTVAVEIEIEDPEQPEDKPEDKPEADKPEADKPATPNKPTTNNAGVTIPATGETMNVVPFIMMLVAIVGLAVSKQKVTE